MLLRYNRYYFLVDGINVWTSDVDSDSQQQTHGDTHMDINGQNSRCVLKHRCLVCFCMFHKKLLLLFFWLKDNCSKKPLEKLFRFFFFSFYFSFSDFNYRFSTSWKIFASLRMKNFFELLSFLFWTSYFVISLIYRLAQRIWKKVFNDKIRNLELLLFKSTFTASPIFVFNF